MRVATHSLLGTAFLVSAWASAQSNINAAAPYAWSENAGWISLRPDCLDGARLSPTSLSGYAWGENIGWIWFGDGSNGDPNGLGVIHDGTGHLTGFAWAENAGWISFNTLSQGGLPVTIGVDGQWTGYAWGENIGWINFGTAYGVQSPAPAEGEPEAEPPCGPVEGEGQGDGEGIIEGPAEGEGSQEGTPEGEGLLEGENDPVVVSATLLLQNFATLDADHGGTLAYQEAFPVIAGVVNKGISLEYGVYQAIDTNHDNAVTVAELRRLSTFEYVHASDTNGDQYISLSELLRVVQLFNSGGLSCAYQAGATEDGYLAVTGGDVSCVRHSSDYAGDPWKIDLQELLRLIQFYNSEGYHYCPGSEDDFCAGP